MKVTEAVALGDETKKFAQYKRGLHDGEIGLISQDPNVSGLLLDHPINF